MEEHEQRTVYCQNDTADLMSDEKTCPNCGQQKGTPFFQQGEFWGLCVAIILFITAFVTVLAK